MTTMALVLISNLYLVEIQAEAQVDYRSRKPSKLEHMKEVNQCTLCHSEKSPKQLNMLDGVLISYSDSPKLCGQCHGERWNEWEQGIHGKQKGGWKVSSLPQSEKMSCVACHDPHSPKYEQMDPKQSPKHPKFLIRKEHSHE